MAYPTFHLIRQTKIDSLNIEVEEYYHKATGARHLHLSADDSNNVFLVGFLTRPQDSTGVAHILEHTTLCGSRHYPVRDPFFMMMRRSLNTFMNAFTGSDKTAYPFASQNAKDFENLLRVYLDAVFFPNLNVLDFAQEGHRIEFETPDDPSTPLVYKGVVFNEMKGALSSPTKRLWQQVHEHLFPTITYHYNSGGDPKDIPKLTHEQLKAFHATHYHPSNAVFMTYGDRPADKHQSLFEECALQHFQALELNLQIPDEQRYSQPQQVVTYYPIEAQESAENKTHIVLAWLLGRSIDPDEMMRVNLLTGILLDHSASPLRYALESTNLGTAPSPLCGFSESTREASFMCGLEGSHLEKANEVEALILKVLEEVAQKGVPQEQIESVLHQIELNQREIAGDHFPYGLQLLVNALSPMIQGGDPVAFLDIDPVLNRLRTACQQPDFISQLVKRLLLENPHRVRVVMAPDPKWAAQEQVEEKQKLERLKTRMTVEEQAAIIKQTAALEIHQQQLNDPELLPKVGLEDIPADLKIPEGTVQTVAHFPATWFARGTNGMVYQYIVIDLPDLSAEQLEILPLFCDILTEVGCQGQDYLKTAARQAAVSGGIHARVSLRGSLANSQKVHGVLALSGKALVRHQSALSELLRDTLETARFDEWSRLRELIRQFRVEQEHSVTGRGHQMAMMACSSGLNPSGYLSHHWYGLACLQKLKALDERLKDDNELKAFVAQLEGIRAQLLTAPRQFLIVSEAEQHESIAENLAQLDWSQPTSEVALFNPSFVPQTIKQAWRTQTQVNFCAKAYPTVPSGHADAPVLMVLGDFLYHGYLHRALREQGGAYGSGAHYDGDTGAFRFYSYRDPRLVETLADFDQALTWLQTTQHEPRALEEALLGLIAHIDRPGSPAGEAIKAFFSSLHGRTPAQRREFRRRILAVTIADLQRVASRYLQPEQAHIAVLSDTQTLTELPDLGLEVLKL